LGVYACALHPDALIDGKHWPVELSAIGDGAVCSSAWTRADAIHATLRITIDDDKQSHVTLDANAPDDATPQAVDDLRAALTAIAEDVRRQATSTTPHDVAPLEMPLEVPAAKQPDMKAITAGSITLTIGLTLSMLTGAVIASGSSTYPGTSYAWPFVPFIGMTVFSATYTAVPDCNCDGSRFLSVFFSGVIDVAQIVGVVAIVAGALAHKTSSVAHVRMTPGGAMFEARF
jgi:hypothetical protein